MRTRTNMFVRAAVLVFIICCIVTIVKMQFEFNSLKKEKAEVEQQIKQYQLKVDKLEEQLDQKYDAEYIMRIARDKLGYRLPDEILFYNDLSK